MKERLKKEYYGIGGDENVAMSQNWYLWIIVVISAFAIAAYVTGSI